MARATAAYWAFTQDAQGNVTAWMWNCEACAAVGTAPTQAGAVRAMNGHVKTDHPRHEYDATPEPRG